MPDYLAFDCCRNTFGDKRYRDFPATKKLSDIMLVFDSVIIDVRSRLRGWWSGVLSESLELLLKDRVAVHSNV